MNLKSSNELLAKSFEPQEFESDLYSFWEQQGCFEGADENQKDQESFCIVLPPPNVTGVLHMGHALTNTTQDTLIRWRKMSGDNALWLPGTDHAGIATQAQVEKAIADEGKNESGKSLTRHDLGRGKFLERTWKWKDDHHGRIVSQMKRLGSALDWSKERFTLDEGCSKAVREVFVRLYNEGLIYKGERIINWCTQSQTALSDLEVIPTERKGNLWHIRYVLVDDAGKDILDSQGKQQSLVIATTRPETLLGDTAVAVHPEDERYKNFHGKKVRLPILGKVLPVILDDYVDREFGTGALKITPAHDFNDYELGKKHDLPFVSVIQKDGLIGSAGGPYVGQTVKKARENIVIDLREQDLLEKVEDHVHMVGLSERTGVVAEPLISKQWFVKIDPLAKPAIEAVETGKIEFVPKTWEKTYFNWMYNIRDWCISRQLWWGHRIPAWYCGRCQHIEVSVKDPKQCSNCQAPADQMQQDEDVLDTWFSSALWPFSTLGWPENTKALKTFYPTAILETGFDIIFFWVARMIMMGIHFMDDVPFRKVYLHAMVRDEKGNKMSKSKGNVIDPLEVMDQHGADALRFTFAVMSGQGRDVKLSLDRVSGYRAFCNKLWNATKFLHLQLEEQNGGSVNEPKGGAEKWITSNYKSLHPVNKWVLSRLQKLNQQVDQSFKDFHLNVAAQGIYDFAWHEFCDWYLEFSKLSLREKGAKREETLIVLHYTLESLLKLLHPMMPFVTEKLWQSLPWKKAVNTLAREKAKQAPVETIMFQSFPVFNENLMDDAAEKDVDRLKLIVQGIRNFRGENQIATKVQFPAYFQTKNQETQLFLETYKSEICKLSNLSDLIETQKKASSENGSFQAVIPLASMELELMVQLEGLVDLEEEKKRLTKAIEKINADLQHVEKKLSNPSFVKRAPEALVTKEKGRQKELKIKLSELESSLGQMS